MKTILTLLLVLLSCITTAQTFEQDLPDDFTAISYTFDLFGSIDKEGINSVLSIDRVDFEWVDWHISCQTIFTSKYSDEGNFKLDYADLLFGAGPMIPLSSRMTITPGIHTGFLYRPKNNIFMGNRGAWTIGVTMKGRLWLGKTKKHGIIILGDYTKAPDVAEKWGRINGSMGWTVIIN